jgi:alkyl hydroperoxide reductase subunit AhpF
MFDLIIIGAAAAGCTAAVYAARRNLNFIIITKDIGGEVALSGEVENWPGQIHTTGVQLAQDFHKHAMSYQTSIKNGLIVTGIKQEGKHHVVSTVDGAGKIEDFTAKTVIVGSGIHPRTLGITGEDTLRGKGVTYCTVCDGPLYKNRITATVGSGNSALESALMMAGIAKQVFVLSKFADTPETNGGFPKGENILIDKLKQLTNVTIIYGAQTKKIIGTDFVTGLAYCDSTGVEHEITVDGVMVHIGMIPNSDFVTTAEKNSAKEIIVNQKCETTVPGIFAAGDVTNIPYKQISIAAGHGATAALAAIEYINRWSE